MNEQELITRGKELSMKIVRLLQEEVDAHEDVRGVLISLFALSKVSASVIRATQDVSESKEDVLGLFISELMNSLEKLDVAIESEVIINKAMGKL